MRFLNNNKTGLRLSRLVPLLALCVLPGLTACSPAKNLQESEDGSFFKKIFSRDTYRLYRIDIQQGNQFTQQQLEKLKIGMTKAQVRYLLGDPITPTIFHNDRWDYVYNFVSGETAASEKRRVTLFFEKDDLVEIRKVVQDRP